MPLIRLHDGSVVRYRQSGADRRGPVLVLIHGAGASSAVWLGVMHRLARTRRSVAMDLPGHGRSSGEVTSIAAMRDAVGVVAASLCLGPAVLVGHSMGGLVALAAALEWPDKVVGLGLVATSARLGAPAPLLHLLEHEWTRWPAFVAEGAYSPEAPRELRRRGANIACAASQAQTLADFRALAKEDLRPRLGEIHAPTVVITGAHDVLAPAKWGAATAGAIRGARLVELPRVGHMPMHEAPERIAQALAPLGLDVP
jgi:3-oxoadipate enol-lactonase/4-carboxymuconolactone decarboxylase